MQRSSSMASLRGIFKSQGGEAAEPVGMGANGIGQLIIDVAGKRRRASRVQRIKTHRGEREDLKVDGRLIHGGNAASTYVEEFGLKLRKLRSGALAIDSGGLEVRLGDEVLFERDYRH